MIQKFQDHKVDPLGLGATYKEHTHGFNEKQWKRLYPTAKVHVNVKIDIKQTGILK